MGGLLVAVAAAGVPLLMGWRWRPPPRRVAALVGRPGRRARRAAAPAQPSSTRTDDTGRARQRPGRSARAGLAVAGAAGGWMLWPPLAAVLLTVVILVPRWRRVLARRRFEEQVRHGFPELIDLLAISLAAGFTPALAIAHLARASPPPFDQALQAVRSRVDAGVRLADALDGLTDVLGEAVRPLASALTSAERYGVALGPTLEILSHEARRQRRHEAEAGAARLPVRLTFPLVLCLLPSFVLLTVVPLLAGALRTLQL